VSLQKRNAVHDVEFFKNLYSADTSVRPQDVIQLFQPKINDEMNSDLCKDFSAEQISYALFQIGPLKAPGPDDFGKIFSEKLGVLKSDVVKAVQFFLSLVLCPRE
jgi:hypothetical protein